MIPASHLFDQPTMTALLEHDPLVADYRAFFASLDWSVVERWHTQRSPLYGSHGHPLSAYLKAFLVRIREGLRYTTQLRAFLVKHPLLVIELGFQSGARCQPALRLRCGSAPCPTRFWLGEKLRQLDHDAIDRATGRNRPRLTGRDPRPGRNRGLRCQAPVRLGQREQPAGLCPGALRQNQTAGRRPGLPVGRQAQYQPGAARWLDRGKKRTALGLWLLRSGRPPSPTTAMWW